MSERLGRIPGAPALLGAFGLAVAVVAWQIVAGAQWFGTTIAPPTDVWAEYTDSARRQVLFDAGLVTAQEAVTGSALAAAVALGVGLVAVLVPALRRGLDQLATIESAVPFVALAPILLATVDRTHVAAAMAACTAFFPIYVAVVSGLHALPVAVGDVFTVFGSNGRRRLTLAQVPAGIPVLATGLKVAMPLAIVGSVIGEWFGSSKGLGPVMLVAMRNYRMPTMWAAVTATVVIALVLYGLTALVERIVSTRFA